MLKLRINGNAKNTRGILRVLLGGFNTLKDVCITHTL